MQITRKLLSRARLGLIVLAMLAAVLPVTACSNSEQNTAAIANYGTYGSDLALEYAAEFPFRSPGSAQEKAAGDFLIKSFKDLGYTPIVTEFAFNDATGNALTSRNIAVLIKGSGFSKLDLDTDKVENLSSQIIIGAHYDSPVPAGAAEATTTSSETAPIATGTETQTQTTVIPVPTLADYDGIQDNASGVGTLLTIAEQIRSVKLGYDVILVAFGAGSSGQAGASYYASQMGSEEVAATDAMYCIDSIYAGSKVYAHSGRNTVKTGNLKDYEKRRKLYEVTDVFFENELYTNNNYMLYTNQSALWVDLAGFAEKVVYREWSLRESDYLPFDALGVPIVYFDSFNYDAKTLEDMQENQNPAFGETGGQISGTQFDSTAYLAQILNNAAATAEITPAASTRINQLTKRVNNTAFVIIEAAKKGMYGATAR